MEVYCFLTLIDLFDWKECLFLPWLYVVFFLRRHSILWMADFVRLGFVIRQNWMIVWFQFIGRTSNHFDITTKKITEVLISAYSRFVLSSHFFFVTFWEWMIWCGWEFSYVGLCSNDFDTTNFDRQIISALSFCLLFYSVLVDFLKCLVIFYRKSCAYYLIGRFCVVSKFDVFENTDFLQEEGNGEEKILFCSFPCDSALLTIKGCSLKCFFIAAKL